MGRSLRIATILLVLLLGFGFSQETMKNRASEAQVALEEEFIPAKRKIARRSPASIGADEVRRPRSGSSYQASQTPESAPYELNSAPEDDYSAPPLVRAPEEVSYATGAGVFRQTMSQFTKPSSKSEESKTAQTTSGRNSYFISNTGIPRAPAASATPPAPVASSSSGGIDSFSINSFAIENGELIITGTNLSSITSITINGGTVNARLIKTGSTSSRLVAMGLSAIELVLGTVYNLVISSAQAQATFPIEVNSDFNALYLKSANPSITMEDTDDVNGSTATIAANSDGNIYYDANANGTITPGGHVFRADNGTKELLVLENSGFVGIGINPFRPLTVGGSITTSVGVITMHMNADGGLGGGVVGTDSNHPVLFTSNNSEKMRLTAAGRLGIGTNNPGALLQVGEPMDATEARANAFTVMSDERLKKDFEIIPDALKKILSLNGYNYYWRSKLSKKKMGLKAQEVQRVFPEVVSRGSDGLLSVSYDHLAAPMIEAMKEQNREIARLKSENEMMKDYLCKKDRKAPMCR